LTKSVNHFADEAVLREWYINSTKSRNQCRVPELDAWIDETGNHACSNVFR